MGGIDLICFDTNYCQIDPFKIYLVHLFFALMAPLPIE